MLYTNSLLHRVKGYPKRHKFCIWGASENLFCLDDEAKCVLVFEIESSDLTAFFFLLLLYIYLFIYSKENDGKTKIDLLNKFLEASFNVLENIKNT